MAQTTSAADLVAFFEEAQLQILQDIARRLARGGAPGRWQLDRLAEITALTNAARSTLGSVPRSTIRALMMRAYLTGSRTAFSELGIRHAPAVSELAARVAPLTDGLALQIQAAYAAVLRSTVDGYRAAVQEAVAAQLLGVTTHQQAAQVAVSRMAERGLTAFVDRSGRQWSLDSYASMATRTAAARSNQTGHLATLSERGHNLVMVSTHARECKLCRPWEGKVLSTDPAIPAKDVQRVAGSVDEAQRAGLNHPRCRHRMVAYFPGITRPVDKDSYAAGVSYEEAQRKAADRRRLSEWRRRQAVAITPEEKARTARKVTEWQARVKGT